MVGLNQNHSSSSGTAYHLQIEDRGPVVDAASETEVRRLNVVVYVNYGEPNARVIYARDHDFDDVRTADHNRMIEKQIQLLALQVPEVIEDWERRQMARIRELLHGYYLNKEESAKKEIESANALYPFLFSKAWRELKEEKARVSAQALPPPAPVPVKTPAAAELEYPLDPELRDRVIEIERLIEDLEEDLQRLKDKGRADDILLQTCRKLVLRAREIVMGRAAAEFSLRRLESTRASLATTWRQIRSRLRADAGRS
ncbi:MAG: hypothetical protein AB7O37_13765 [Vicinamibacteria bacterium]